MPVIDEIYVREGNTRLPIDSYDNTMIDEINIDGVIYHFANESNVTGTGDVKCANAVEEPLINCVIEGNSLQDGTPTPDAPIEVESVGELVTDTTNANYGKYKIPVVARGKNLLKPTVISTSEIRTNRKPMITNLYGTTIDTTDLSDNKVVITQVANSNYAPISYYNGYLTIQTRDDLVVGKQYRVSFDIDIIDNPLGATYISILSPNGSNQRNCSFTSAKQRVKFTYIHTDKKREDDYPYLEIRCMGMSFTASNFMITNLDFDESFEPYVEPVTTNIYLDEPLRKIGDYADYIDFKGNKVIRNTFVRVYNGKTETSNPFNKSDNEENWAGSENHGDVLENFWLYTLNDTLPIIPKNGHHSAKDFQQVPICLQLPVKTGYYDSNTADATVNKEMLWFCQQGRCVRLYLSKDRVGGTRGNILTYLKNNPITVVFATYQPYEEPLNIELPQLPAQTAIIEIDTELQAGLTVDYWKQITPDE